MLKVALRGCHGLMGEECRRPIPAPQPASFCQDSWGLYRSEVPGIEGPRRV